MTVCITCILLWNTCGFPLFQACVIMMSSTTSCNGKWHIPIIFTLYKWIRDESYVYFDDHSFLIIFFLSCCRHSCMQDARGAYEFNEIGLGFAPLLRSRAWREPLSLKFLFMYGWVSIYKDKFLSLFFPCGISSISFQISNFKGAIWESISHSPKHNFE